MSAPLSHKAQAKIPDRKRRKGAEDVGNRRGRPVTAAEFTKHLEITHAQRDYAPIPMLKFKLGEEM